MTDPNLEWTTSIPKNPGVYFVSVCADFNSFIEEGGDVNRDKLIKSLNENAVLSVAVMRYNEITGEPKMKIDIPNVLTSYKTFVFFAGPVTMPVLPQTLIVEPPSV
jgi:hypothetical protein